MDTFQEAYEIGRNWLDAAALDPRPILNCLAVKQRPGPFGAEPLTLDRHDRTAVGLQQCLHDGCQSNFTLSDPGIRGSWDKT